MSPDFSNIITFRLLSDRERYTWAGFLIMVVLVSLLANTIILVGSIKYRAIKVHRMIITYIEQMAICHYMFTACIILPSSVCAIQDKWIFGRMYCVFSVYILNYFYSVNMLLICGMTTNRLLILKYPLKARSFSRTEGHIKVIASVWFLAMLYLFLFLASDNGDFFVNYKGYTCDYGFSTNTWILLGRLFISQCVPWIIAIAEGILVYQLYESVKAAKRTRAKFQWQGIVTVLLIAGVFIISTLPQTIYILSYSVFSLGANDNLTVGLLSSPTYYRICTAGYYFNVTINFLIYFVMIPKFRSFIRERICHPVITISSCLSSYLLLLNVTPAEERNIERRRVRADTAV